MTIRQARWAAQHDWCLQAAGSYEEGYTVTTTTGERFSSFIELYIWAGY